MNSIPLKMSYKLNLYFNLNNSRTTMQATAKGEGFILITFFPFNFTRRPRG